MLSKLVASLLLMQLTLNGNAARGIWVLLNLLDTMRALRKVRPNGRRVGSTTRRREMRRALGCWLVFMASGPVEPIMELMLSWVPFYYIIKLAVYGIFIIWRLELSSVAFNGILAPFIRRYETHIDLTLQLLWASIQMICHFLWQAPVQVASSHIQGFKWPSFRSIDDPNMIAEAILKTAETANIPEAPLSAKCCAPLKTSITHRPNLSMSINPQRSHLRVPGEPSVLRRSPRRPLSLSGDINPVTDTVNRLGKAGPPESLKSRPKSGIPRLLLPQAPTDTPLSMKLPNPADNFENQNVSSLTPVIRHVNIPKLPLKRVTSTEVMAKAVKNKKRKASGTDHLSHPPSKKTSQVPRTQPVAFCSDAAAKISASRIQTGKTGHATRRVVASSASILSKGNKLNHDLPVVSTTDVSNKRRIPADSTREAKPVSKRAHVDLRKI